MKCTERSRFVLTFESIGILLISFLLFLASSYLLNVASNYASYLSPSNEQFPILPDLGFEIIPKTEALYLTDVFDNIMIFCSMVYMLLQDKQPIYSYSKYLVCFSATYLLKSFTVFVTSFPDPRFGCQRITEGFFSTFVLHRCGDCMFSGHAVVLSLFGIYWLTVRPVKKDVTFYFLRTLMGAVAIMGYWAIIANRSHYTVDVIVAIYVSIGVWFTVAYFEESYIRKNGLLLGLTCPETYNRHKQ